MIKKIKKTLFQIFFPIKCIYCYQEGESICKSCLEKIKIKKNIFKRKNFVLYWGLDYHSTQLKKLIKGYKYDFNKNLLPYITDLYKKILDINDIRNGYIIPIPSHYKRRFSRGFDHIDLIARAISNNNFIYTNILKRKKNTRKQSLLNKQNKKMNLYNAFKSKKTNLEANKNIIIIDDITTTKNTLQVAVDAIQSNYPNKIICVTLGKG